MTAMNDGVAGIELRPVTSVDDILPMYRGTPLESMLRYHNLREQRPPTSGSPVLLVSMCMDHRKELHIPNEFAYILRSAGGNLRDSEFEVSYAIAVGGVDTIALLAHTDCGMAHVSAKRDRFVNGLVSRAGWSQDEALRHFEEASSRYEIGDAALFVAAEAKRLRTRYPRVLVGPFLYAVESDLLAQVVETGAG